MDTITKCYEHGDERNLGYMCGKYYVTMFVIGLNCELEKQNLVEEIVVCN
jgi:hypothetical protein